MTALTSLSDYVNRATGGNSGTPENTFWFKYPYIANTVDTWAAGLMYSTWKYDGFPGPGATPTTVTAPTNATAGAIPFTDPGGGRQKWLMSAGIGSSPTDVGYVILYDRLLQIGGLDGTNTGAQTVGGSLTRNTGGAGNQIWIDITTAVGTTARTITASYTNQAGTSGRTTAAVTFGGTAGTVGNDANLLIPLPLQAGDTGVQAVASVTIGTGSTGTAGNFGVLVVKPIAFLTFEESGSATKNFAVGMPGVPALESGACIGCAVYANTTTERPVFGALGFVES